MPNNMREFEKIANLGVEERKNLEAKFLDQKSFSAMGKEEKVTLIKEYMYLQGKEEKGFTKDKNFSLYGEVKHGDAFHKAENMVDTMAENMKNGADCLTELKSGHVKTFFYGETIFGDTKKKGLEEYAQALKNGTAKDLRLGWEEDARNKEQAKIEQEQRLKKEREESSRREEIRRNEEAARRDREEKVRKELREQEEKARQERWEQEIVEKVTRQEAEEAERIRVEQEKEELKREYYKKVEEKEKDREAEKAKEKAAYEKQQKIWKEQDEAEKKEQAERQKRQEERDRKFAADEAKKRVDEKRRMAEIEKTLRGKVPGEADIRLMEEYLELKGRADENYDPKTMSSALRRGTRGNTELRRALNLIIDTAESGKEALQMLNHDYIRNMAYRGMGNIWDQKVVTKEERKRQRESFEKPILDKLQNEYKNALKDKQVEKVAAIENKLKQLENINVEAEKHTTRQKQNTMLQEVQAGKKKLNADDSSTTLRGMLKSIEAAKVGVLWGSGEYDKACDALKALETSCKKWLDTQADGPSPEKGIKEQEQMRKDIVTARARILRYFNRKRDQGKMKGNDLTSRTDAKGVKRISLMKEADQLLEKMALNLDGQDLSLPMEKQSAADLIAPANEKQARKQMDGLVQRGAEQLSRFEARTAELGVASLVFEEMLSGKLGDEFRIKINGKDDFKKVIKSIANSKAVKDAFPKKVTGNMVKELISADSIRRIAKSVTKEMTPKQIAPKKQVKMFKPAAM